MTHDELESRVVAEGREIERQLLEDHFELRAINEPRREPEEVRDASGASHNMMERGHKRALTTLVGTVAVPRLAYRADGRPNLHPADALANLPAERYSYGLRELAAIEATRGSYEEAAAAIERACGLVVGKRQLEQLVDRAVADVESFYASQERPEEPQATDVLVISADGKGIAMRPEALRPATAEAARSSNKKLKARLSKGEKSSTKRMAELVVVYDCEPKERSVEDIFSSDESSAEKRPAPEAKNKWLSASVVEDAKEVIKAAFEEAERRDPEHLRPWVALVDGAKHQIDVINAEAKKRKVDVSIVVDCVHVLEYIWGAAWCFFDEGDAAAEDWVVEKARAVLCGDSSLVAASIRRKATCLGLDKHKRKKADECANYLLAKRPYLNYPTALARGWPIATGVIEGACRFLVRDRLGVTGARWGLKGAEAVLKLRAVRANGDWNTYFRYHKEQERRRVHEPQYFNGAVPQAA